MITQNSEFFKTLTECSSDIIAVIAEDGTLKYISPSIIDVLGYTQTERIGKKIYDNFYPEDLPQIRRHLKRLVSEPSRQHTFKTRYRHKSGKLLWLEVTGRNFIHNPDVRGLVVNARDITDTRSAELTAEENIKKFETIFMHSNDAIFLADADTGIIADANLKAEELLGRNRNEIPGMHQSKLHPKEQREVTRQSFKKDADGIDLDRYRMFHILRKTGETVPVEISPNIVEHNRKKYVLGIFRDISKRQKHEEFLRQILNLYKETENIPVDEIFHRGLEIATTFSESEYGYFHVVDPHTQQITMKTWNDRAMKKCSVDYITATYPLSEAGFWADCVRERKPVIHNCHIGDNEENRLPEGHVPINRHISVPVIMHEKVTAIMGLAGKHTDYTDTDANNLMMLAGIIYSIRKRKIAERELRRSEIRFRNLFNQSAVGIAIIDKYFRIKDANAKLAEMLEIPVTELIGKTVADITHEKDPRLLEALNTNTLFEIKERSSFEKRYRTKSGKSFWGYIHTQTIRNNIGEIDYIIGSVTDISKIKDAENALREREKELRELNASKDRFFNIIAHDLKNPFNSVLGLSKIAYERAAKNDFSNIGEICRALYHTAKNSYNLLTNLLSWAMVQTGKIKFSPTEFDLKDLIADVEKLYQAQAMEKKIKLDIGIDEALYIYADRQMIHSVFRNLVSNAIKFTPPHGKITVTVFDSTELTRIDISDNGIGISEEDVKKLFDIDRETSTHGTENEEGTGLGLILCKEFASFHKGKISVKSTLGKGSTFSLSLPKAEM